MSHMIIQKTYNFTTRQWHSFLNNESFGSNKTPVRVRSGTLKACDVSLNEQNGLTPSFARATRYNLALVYS